MKNKEEKQKIENEIKEVKKANKDARNAIIYGTDSKGNPKKEAPTWKEMTKEQRAGAIVTTILVIISFAYVIIICIAPTQWPDSFLAKILTNTHPTDGSWWDVNGVPVMLCLFFALLFLGCSRVIRTVLTVSTKKAGKKTRTIVKITNSAVKYMAWIFLVFACLGVWGVNTSTLIASAGILALVIGLGAQSLIADIISGVSIVFENQFEVGDTVVVDNFRGVVTDIGLSITKITDAAGNIKSIRNSQITTAINLSQENSLAVVDIPVDYDTDLSFVRTVIENNLKRIVKEVPGIIGTPQYLGVQEFQNSGVLLRLIASTAEENKFSVARKINEVMFNIFRENNITIPFNQVVVSQRKEK